VAWRPRRSGSRTTFAAGAPETRHAPNPDSPSLRQAQSVRPSPGHPQRTAPLPRPVRLAHQSTTLRQAHCRVPTGRWAASSGGRQPKRSWPPGCGANRGLSADRNVLRHQGR
jgi:hypothetical protein